MTATEPHIISATVESRPWGRALLWLALLGPFFFLSYGFANWVTAQRAHVPAIVFAWEQRIPFIEWTIVPYWSTDLLYAMSFFVCTTRRELGNHAGRLLAAQLISITAFLLFPLRFTFVRPETHGLFGWMFGVLGGFDKPFNQAPSLHLSLTTILWALYSSHLKGAVLWICRGWLVLAGLSTLTTYQHHVIDLPTGVLVGLISVGLFSGTRYDGRFRYAAAYLASALLLASVAVRIDGWAWMLLWPASALLIAALAYATNRPGVFTKKLGSMNPIALALTAPYTVAAWINSRLWTRDDAEPREIAEGVWIGRLPRRAERDAIGIRSMVDLTAELPVEVGGVVYRAVPMLDLAIPSFEQISSAVNAVEELRMERPTLVCCALGYSRSAATVAAWLVASGRAASVEAAIGAMRKHRPGIVLGPAHRQRLAEWAASRQLAQDRAQLAPPAHGNLAIESLLAASITVGMKFLTGAQCRWVGCCPSNTQRIYFANHSSHIDFVLLWAALPPALRLKTRPVAAADYWERGALRRYFTRRVFHAILVDRCPAAHGDPLQPMLEALDRGESLILFPEGTRGAGECLLPFKSGIYHLAKARPNVELIPALMDNCYRVMPKRAIFPVPLLCSVTFGKPAKLAPHEGKTEFLARLRSAICELGAI